jgi:hypothetical protein
MPTILEYIKYLTPAGTRPQQRESYVPTGTDPWAAPPVEEGNAPWAMFPEWPGDLFAITASLVSMSECYSHSRYSNMTVFDEATHAELRELAALFEFPFPDNTLNTKQTVDELIRELEGIREQRVRERDSKDKPLFCWWKDLVEVHAHVHVDARPSSEGAIPGWWDAAMKLLIIADEACTGVGFLLPNREGLIQANVTFSRYRDYQQALKEKKGWPNRPDIIRLPSSLCSVVPACKATVHPKTLTVQSGLTINNLTHHLALLPSHSQVKTEWRWGLEESDLPETEKIHENLLIKETRILLIPFPFTVENSAFMAGKPCSFDANDTARFFSMNPTWLLDLNGQKLLAQKIADELILPLIEAATRQQEQPDWVMLPELALEKELAAEIADILAEKTKIELFISGISISAEPPCRELARNAVYGAVISADPKNPGVRIVSDTWIQSKHHRWKLEHSQIRKYGLGDVLEESKHWWEAIEVFDRKCVFWVFRGLASMASLVCEDLARIHPVQSVLRAVGVNLVFALLMDEEQQEYRWASRYATVLADDPGSSVLVLTSLAFIERVCQTDAEKQSQHAYKVGVWRESSRTTEEPLLTTNGVPDVDMSRLLCQGRAIPLELHRGQHALLLKIDGTRSTAFSLDGRNDQGMTIHLRLRSTLEVSIGESMPAWAKYPWG